MKSFEIYNNSFFNSDIENIPEVIIYYDQANSNDIVTSALFKFKDDGYTQNSYQLSNDGITLIAQNIDDVYSKMRASFRRDVLFSNGVAANVHTYTLDQIKMDILISKELKWA